MTSQVSGKPDFDEIDLSADEFWAATGDVRELSYSILREHRPVSWHRPVEAALMPQLPTDEGFWAVVSHADIVEVSRRNDVFISSKGVYLEPAPIEMLEAAMSIIGMDLPRQSKIRRLVSAAFTPRQVQFLVGSIESNAKTIVQGLIAAGSGADFVREFASKLPLVTFADMVGVAESDREEVQTAADALVSAFDPDYLGDRNIIEVILGSQFYLHEVASRLAEDRRSAPKDDLITNLVQAEVDGHQLTNAEIAAFFVLLSVAANDTTRQTTSHAMRALTLHPEQREWLLADFDNRINTAIDEFVRWATPVMTFARIATQDHVLGGQQIAAGDKVVMFYSSGNRDAKVFDRPHEFDLSRTPNPHIGFGGGGVHFCLGTQVAKAQLRALFRELLTELPRIEVGEPKYLASNFIHGVRSMPCVF